MKTVLVQSSESQKLKQAIKNLTNKGVKVGWFQGLTYDDKDKTPVAAVAAQNEFGNPMKNIPARPFLRPTIAREERNWQKLAKQGAVQIIQGHANIDQMLELIGRKATADVQVSIKKVYSPALAGRTVLARIKRSSRLSKIKGRISEGSLGNVTKPLIDTGYMISTVSHELTDE